MAWRVLANWRVNNSDSGKRIKTKKISVNPFYPRHQRSMNSHIHVIIARNKSAHTVHAFADRHKRTEKRTTCYGLLWPVMARQAY